jgi:hypothetical protein
MLHSFNMKKFHNHIFVKHWNIIISLVLAITFIYTLYILKIKYIIILKHLQ